MPRFVASVRVAVTVCDCDVGQLTHDQIAGHSWVFVLIAVFHVPNVGVADMVIVPPVADPLNTTPAQIWHPAGGVKLAVVTAVPVVVIVATAGDDEWILSGTTPPR